MKRIKKDDARFKTPMQQTIQRVETLYDILGTLNITNFEQLPKQTFPKGVLQRIAKKHGVTMHKLYRWIREYKKDKGVHISLRGRVANT